MKKTFRILSAFLAVVLLVGCFVSCGNNTSDSEDTKADNPNKSDVTGTTDPEESEASGTFKIGFIGPITGGAAIYGTAAMNGAKIAVDEINALNGNVKLELKCEDDVHDNETSINAYNTLLDWGVQAIVGCVTTGPCVAVSAKAYEDRVFMMTPSASSTDVIDNKDNMYQICFTDPNQGIASADYMAENMPDAKIAIIYMNDDIYSQGIRNTFVEEAEQKNLSVVYEGTFTKDTSTDFTVQLTAAKSKGADLIFLPMYYTPASVILKQASDMGYAPTFFGVDGMDGILAMEGFDTSLAEGVMLLTPFSADAQDERTKTFVKSFEELANDIPNQFAADAYDAVYAIYEAILVAGCTADQDCETICDALIEVMPELEVSGLTGTMTWDESGAVSKTPMAVVIKDGNYVLPTND